MGYKKIVDYDCPKCGNDENCETLDFMLDCDCATMQVHCCKCDSVWYEYFLLKYDGYAMDGKVYDKDGEDASV